MFCCDIKNLAPKIFKFVTQVKLIYAMNPFCSPPFRLQCPSPWEKVIGAMKKDSAEHRMKIPMTILGKYLLRPKICCFYEKLTVNSFTFTALHSADKFSDKQQILRLIFIPWLLLSLCCCCLCRFLELLLDSL